MKHFLLLLLTAALFMVACKSEKPETPEKETPALEPYDINTNTGTPEAKNPTEHYYGTVNGVGIIFKHLDYTKYRLKTDGKTTKGAMNTERGFENDADATVYILNSDKPESEQKYFVRYTDGRFVMLDAKRKVIPGSDFKKK